VSTPAPETHPTTATSDPLDVVGGSADGALQRHAARLLGSRLFWVLFLLVAFGWPIVRVFRTTLPPFLPVLGTVSDFELVDQNGRPYGTAELRGRVWLASTIETASMQAADKLATEVGKIQHRVRNLGPAFHLVTLAVDPELDTPPRLLEFAGHHRVSPRMWSFLSGKKDDIEQAERTLGLRNGAHTDPAAPKIDGSPMTVILVDAQMRVRGRYDLADPDAIDTLLHHAGLLVNRGN
jgi:protein SCO1/2